MRDPLDSMDLIAAGYEGSTAQDELNCSGL